MGFSPDELEIDVYRSGGNDSAVRVTHMPTGTVVFADDDQLSRKQNYEEALRRLRETLGE
jgi:protein subunit release factor A